MNQSPLSPLSSFLQIDFCVSSPSTFAEVHRSCHGCRYTSVSLRTHGYSNMRYCIVGRYFLQSIYRTASTFLVPLFLFFPVLSPFLSALFSPSSFAFPVLSYLSQLLPFPVAFCSTLLCVCYSWSVFSLPSFGLSLLPWERWWVVLNAIERVLCLRPLLRAKE